MVETPVLIATFARPEYARKTFDAIKKAKPKKLYFYSNKAREDNTDEIKRNEEVRALVKEVDWDCELKTWFRDEYVDLYTSLWGAYDWVFENEEQAIILEEDCVASMAFFDFCDQLLPKYKDDSRVWHISGNNFIEGYNPSGYDYIFSPFAFQYGWASWSSRWKKLHREGFDVNAIVQSDLYFQIYGGNRKAAKGAYEWLRKQQDSDAWYRPVAWDYTFQMTMRVNGGFGIVPLENLVSNIGEFGTHNKGNNKKIHNLNVMETPNYNIEKHPMYMVSDARFTRMFYRKIVRLNRSLFMRGLNYIRRRINI